MTVLERITFTADGLADGRELVGELRLPDGPGPFPAVALTGPFTGVKEQVTGVYAERLTASGFVTLAFDHRGFGESPGRSGHEDSQGKLADLRAAVGTLARRTEVAEDRVGLVGICLGGGHGPPGAGGGRDRGGVQQSGVVRPGHGCRRLPHRPGLVPGAVRRDAARRRARRRGGGHVRCGAVRVLRHRARRRPALGQSRHPWLAALADDLRRPGRRRTAGRHTAVDRARQGGRLLPAGTRRRDVRAGRRTEGDPPARLRTAHRPVRRRPPCGPGDPGDRGLPPPPPGLRAGRSEHTPCPLRTEPDRKGP
ncbi:alpha/beta hydrolase [Streptomyces ferrugineus]|uniref:alpha/beta hydrolase n=1 Tax=Streptomyces ferrugineus TaxID=1413221 RepID=UPI001D14D524